MINYYKLCNEPVLTYRQLVTLHHFHHYNYYVNKFTSSTLKAHYLKNVNMWGKGGGERCKYFYMCVYVLTVVLQILGRKFYKHSKKSNLSSQSILIFIHKTPVVEKKREKLENYYGPGRHRRSIFT